MKFALVLFVATVLLVGCLHGGSVSFDKYDNAALGFSFEKPSHWVQVNDPLSFVRFTDVNKSSFSVSILPNLKASDFDKKVNEVYLSFTGNSGFLNVSRENAVVAGFYAVKISADQRDSTSGGEYLSASDLYIVKDTTRDRVLLLGFILRRDASLDKSREVQKRILDSFKVY